MEIKIQCVASDPDSIPRQPEVKLLMAVLIRAVKDLFHEDRDIAVNALQFFLRKRIKKWSFRWICTHLDVDPAPLYNQVVEYRYNIRKSPLKELVYRR